MNILIAGTGFIGSAVAKALSDEHNVTSFDLQSPRLEGIKFVYGNALDLKTCRRAVAGQDWVLIKIGLMGGIPSFKYSAKYHNVNVLAALNIIQAAAEANVKCVQFDSTEAIFGPNDDSPFLENQWPHPASVYGATKFIVENYLRTMAQRTGLKFIIFRYPRVVSVINDNILTRAWKKFNEKRCYEFIECGRYVIDLVHVEDVVAAHKRVLELEKTDDIYHIGPGEGWSIKSIISRFAEYTDFDIKTTDVGRPRNQLMEMDFTHSEMFLATNETVKKLMWTPRNISSVIEKVAMDII